MDFEKGKRYNIAGNITISEENSNAHWLYDPDKDFERLSGMHKTKVRENRELWEENKRLKGE